MSLPRIAVYLLFVGLLQASCSGLGTVEEDFPAVTYDNFTLFRVWTRRNAIIEDGFHNGIVLSNDPQSSSFNIVIPPEDLPNFLSDINDRQWNFKLLTENIQPLIDQERTLNDQIRMRRSEYSWDHYATYDEMNTWMKRLSENYPEVTLYNIGKSHRGRNTHAISLSRRANNPVVFIESAIHSREWISPATSTWIFNHLLTSNDEEVKRLSEEYDWYLVPIVNPDGYVHTHTGNRLWRKNMKRSILCQGTDINRNWDYHWREVGASSNACNDAYAGSAPMSEVETRNLDNFVKGISSRVKLYLSFHAYSQLLLWPEGHTKERIPEFDHYEAIGKATVEAIAKRYGTKYERGSIIEAIYPASGTTIDYMRAKYNIPLSFCFELRPGRDAKGVGFILEPEQIIPTSEETFDGVAAMIWEGKKLGYM